MMKILIAILWLVSVLVTQAEGVDTSGQEDNIESIIPAHEVEYLNSKRMLREAPTYKGEIDVLVDDPITLNGTIDCWGGKIGDDPANGNMYQLNLQANFCHTFNTDSEWVNRLRLYKGIATDFDDAIFVEDLKWNMKLAPSPEDGKYILAIYPDYHPQHEFACNYEVSSRYEYKIHIKREPCPSGEVTYDGVIDVEDSLAATSIRRSIQCGETDGRPTATSIMKSPELWQLWQLNLPPLACFTITLERRSCTMVPSMSLYKGIATGAVPGSSPSSPTALVNATYLKHSVDASEELDQKYCSFDEYGWNADSEWGYPQRVTFNDANSDDGVFTLAIQYDSRDNRCRVPRDISYEYELEIQLHGCNGGLLFRETCYRDYQCKSKLCTGRPGISKTKKCRFCARKNQLCSVDSDCCQTEQLPGRHCKDGQCKKRSSNGARMVARYFNDFFVVDTSTGEVSRQGVNFFPDNIYSIDFDSTTRMLYGWHRNYSLFKMNPNTGSVIDRVPIKDFNYVFKAMKFVSGKIYAAHNANTNDSHDSLVSLEPATGAVATVGRISIAPFVPLPDGIAPTAAVDVGDLAYDGSTMYGLVNYMYNGIRAIFYLVTIDLETATITSSVPIALALGVKFYGIRDIEFGSDGVLYCKTSKDLYSLDKATGVATYIGSSGEACYGLTLIS